MDRPIIQTLFDLDMYKLTMLQLAWLKWPDIKVKLRFNNRTKSVRLPDTIPIEALREELDSARTLRFSEKEIAYLRESKYIPRGMFCEGFLDFLSSYQLPEINVDVVDGEFRVEVEAHWPEASLWETLNLSIMNELFNAFTLQSGGHDWSAPIYDGLFRKLCKVQDLMGSNLRDSLVPQCLVEFGTRRRFARWWQDDVTAELCYQTDLFAGTSNVRLAQELDVRPIGTFAHEMDMVYSRLFGDSDDAIRESHQLMLQDWWDLYGEPLSIALSDTYGTNFFLEDFTDEQAREWRGLRHDSGPWKQFGDKVIAFYERKGIDPKSKTIVWSDGLTPDVVFAINREFGQRIRCVYGWGTNLTNDFGPDAKKEFGIQPLSIVMKVVESNGLPTVKLSDNPAKAVGPAEVVARFQRIFGYNPADYQYEECVY